MKALKEIATGSEHTAEEFAREMRARPDSMECAYFRFNVENGLQNIGLEEWKLSKEISAATNRYLGSSAVVDELENCARGLLNAISSATACSRAFRNMN